MKQKHYIRILLALGLAAWAGYLMTSSPAGAALAPQEALSLGPRAWAEGPTAGEDRKFETLPYIEKMNEIEYLIRQRARGSGVDEETAVSIAKCESSLEPEARSETSSAVGLYQFLIGTWKWIGAEDQGLDRLNPEHSLEMFLKWFPRYPEWWKECLGR